MNFSFQDMYPTMASNQLPTPDQTIPVADNEMEFNGIVDTNESTGATTTDNSSGMKVAAPNNKTLLYGSMILIFVVLVVIHFMD